MLEEVGPRLVHTKFGTEQAADSIFNVENDEAFQSKCDLIVSKALDAYVRSEYGNLWETHQCRPHAYGHTWSPGYELAAGMLHGHAVATGMGFGAYLSFYQVGTMKRCFRWHDRWRKKKKKRKKEKEKEEERRRGRRKTMEGEKNTPTNN